MANVAFDTLTASKDLHKAGIEMAQAEAIALVVKDSQGSLATKADIDLVKAALSTNIELVKTELGTNIELVKTELGNDIELIKTELEKLEAKLTTDNEKLRTEFDARIKNVESGLTWLKWVVGVQMAVMIGGFSIMIGGFSILFSRLPMP